MIHDMPTENYYRGRIQRSRAAARPDPELVVRDYLSAMEARDLDKGQHAVGRGLYNDFPGHRANDDA